MSTGNGRAPSARPAAGGTGFTLVEMLLVLAIVAAVGTLFVAAAATALRAQQPRPAELFWRAVSVARESSVQSGQPTRLEADPKSGMLVIHSAAGALPHDLAGCRLTLLSVSDQRAVLLGGQLVETGEIPFVRFYPEGTCDPFRAQLLEPDGRRTVLLIDPWTCAPVLPAAPPS